MQGPNLLAQLSAALAPLRVQGPADSAESDAGDSPVSVAGARPNSGNALLAALSPHALARLRDRGSRVSLIQDSILQSPGAPSGEIYFPMSGVVSVSRSLGGGEAVETHMVGREGALGLSVALGSDTSRDWARVTIAGEALVVSPAAFRETLAQQPSLSAIVHRYQADLIDELEQRTACSAAHDLSQRLAGWLLRCRARAGSDNLEVTQEHLSRALSAQRTTIGFVARHFKEAGLLTYSRGRVRIIDFQQLEKIACGCHREADTAHRLARRPEPRGD